MTLRHLWGGPEHDTAHRCPRGTIVVGALGIPETREFAGAGRVNEDVVGFNVLKRNGDE